MAFAGAATICRHDLVVQFVPIYRAVAAQGPNEILTHKQIAFSRSTDFQIYNFDSTESPLTSQYSHESQQPFSTMSSPNDPSMPVIERYRSYGIGGRGNLRKYQRPRMGRL